MSNSPSLQIILVEDSEDLCRGWSELLTLNGHEVNTFLCGRDILENENALQNSNIFITDYYLPDMNGLDLISRVRAVRKNLPVILLTGAQEPAIAEKLNEYQNTLLLSKPLRIDALEEGMSQLLTSDRGGA